MVSPPVKGVNPSGLRNPQACLRHGRRQEAEPCKNYGVISFPLLFYFLHFHLIYIIVFEYFPLQTNNNQSLISSIVQS